MCGTALLYSIIYFIVVIIYGILLQYFMFLKTRKISIGFYLTYNEIVRNDFCDEENIKSLIYDISNYI